MFVAFLVSDFGMYRNFSMVKQAGKKSSALHVSSTLRLSFYKAFIIIATTIIDHLLQDVMLTILHMYRELNLCHSPMR